MFNVLFFVKQAGNRQEQYKLARQQRKKILDRHRLYRGTSRQGKLMVLLLLCVGCYCRY